MNKPSDHLLLCLLTLITAFQLNFVFDFLFNGFESSDVSLSGNATIESRILTLTNETQFSIRRVLYPSKIPTKIPNSSFVLPFSTSFIFAMAPYKGRLSGHDNFFFFVPHVGIQGTSSAQHLDLLNITNNGNESNHVFGVEFDVFANEEFNNIDDDCNNKFSSIVRQYCHNKL